MSTTTTSVSSTPGSTPPLFGDGHGKYRILLLGNSGKRSTTGRELAAILGVPSIGARAGRAPSPEELKAKVGATLGEAGGSWVADGDYRTKLGNFVLDKTTDVVWLDPPLALYFPRILLRTILRLLRIEAPCSPGCPERFSEVLFSKDSILWWCLTHHRSNRERNQERMAEIGIGCGTRRRMRRLGGWGEERRVWLESVKELAKGE
ncbi:hypothetical protein FA13DRAFT_1754569 [Coprinellus micaceus]|uniref:Adenylate kinase n=1 Tax=Coprinellus micaceus TaxID=71717 RepID=A0A4Y7TF37_COPMI|nr:hypothetical protein FA13DRAFT_1754569 [Coprinellus micaceus]